MRDPRLQAAVDHWGPRFMAQGIDYNDFNRTIAPLQQWAEWLPAWVALGDEHAALAREAEQADRMLSAGTAYAQAALCYHFAKFVWMVDMTRHRAAARRAIDCLYAAHRLLDPRAERIEVPFEGHALVANLRRPAGEGRPPLVILIPGLDSAKEEFFSWENVFLARGLATLSLDGPGQGESAETTQIRPDYEVAVSAALDALSGRDDVDLRRTGAAGVSLGGYYGPRAAAFESRLIAAAAIGGPYDFGACWEQLPLLTREAFVHYSGASDDAAGCELAARLSLRGVLPRVQQPLLVVFGKLDRLIPWQQAEQAAREAPHARLVMYPDGNHVCNNIPHKYRPLVADWLREQLAHAA